MPKKADNSKDDPVVTRLNAVIALLAQESIKGGGRSILSLSNAGLRPIEIARILGKSEKYVSKELSVAWKKSKERGAKR